MQKFILAFLMSSTGATAGAVSDMKAPSTPEDAPGIAVYEQVCTYCHDHNGVAPVILGRQLPAILTKTLVRSGVGAMPAFRLTEISDSELNSLADWLAKKP